MFCEIPVLKSNIQYNILSKINITQYTKSKHLGILDPEYKIQIVFIPIKSICHCGGFFDGILTFVLFCKHKFFKYHLEDCFMI